MTPTFEQLKAGEGTLVYTGKNFLEMTVEELQLAVFQMFKDNEKLRGEVRSRSEAVSGLMCDIVKTRKA